MHASVEITLVIFIGIAVPTLSIAENCRQKVPSGKTRCLEGNDMTRAREMDALPTKANSIHRSSFEQDWKLRRMHLSSIADFRELSPNRVTN